MIDRRRLLQASTSCFVPQLLKSARGESFDLYDFEHHRVVTAADRYLAEKPVTVTDTQSSRSAGGKHDYFSEGDYWWPDPKKPDGPYIQRDGMSNPGNFDAHREALLRLSVQVPALCAAWLLTKHERYAQHAADHLRAWFVNPDTRMNPNLQYAQAIHGRSTGRATGIIDTLQLVEVARAASASASSGAMNAAEQEQLRKWFSDYLLWLTTSKNGVAEREAKNNHGTCWVLQVAEFATFCGDEKLRSDCRDRLKNVIMPGQIAPDGSLPLELRRTKPYSYSLFNLEVMAGVCQVLSTPSDNLWTFTLPDGRSVGKAVSYMYPYIADKSKWPYPSDVMYFNQWPLREQSLLFAGIALGRFEYLTLWRRLKGDPHVEEAIRNYPLRQPVLWVSRSAGKVRNSKPAGGSTK